jgi:ADP-ribose pyrophosphatase YjhB (NUDIX family)
MPRGLSPGADPPWLHHAKALQAIAQTGLTYARDPYDIERYQAVRRIAAELLAAGAGADPAQVLGLFSDERAYATPKVAVNGAIFREGTILLVRERRDGEWTLPGGWADVNDTPSAAVEREIAEESGYRARAVRLLALYDRDHPRHGHTPQRSHIYKLFFQCELLDEVAEPLPDGGETDAIGFFGPDKLPQLSLARVTPGQIARFFALHAHPDWPTDFD